MRKVTYVSNNGTVYTTLAKALESGEGFRTVVETIESEPVKLTEKQLAMRIKL